MIISKNWLQEYIEEELPSADELALKLGLHSFEVEGVEMLGDDALLDIDVLPNRAHDALSYLGMAREVATVCGLTFRMPELSFEVNDFSTEDFITLDIENPSLVPRALKKIVKNIEVESSPTWLEGRLQAMGQKSINNIVDMTNFVMYEFGQPVHAFDFDKLAKDEKGIAHIHIRGAHKGEAITMLDGSTYELEEGMLVIADDEKALDIAGVKGGISSGIDENTKTIMLSVCTFEDSNIRRTSRTLGLRTDASSRFEKGLAPETPPLAMQRLCHLIGGLVEGEEIAKDFLDVYPRPLAPYKVGMRRERLCSLLGVDIKNEEIESILERLGFSYEKVTPRDMIVQEALVHSGASYAYGASVRADAPKSFDCSSFVAYLYASLGVSLPRISIDQYVYGESILKDELQAGDLVFSNSGNGAIRYETVEYMKGTHVGGGIDHVGIYIGEGKVIHASKHNNAVVIENMDTTDSFKNTTGYCRIPNTESERYVITVPFYRLDIRIEEDVIEEMGRIYGYQNITEAKVYKGHGPVEIHKEFYWIQKIKDILVDNGFSEVVTYSFVAEGEVELENALSVDKKFLRPSLEAGVMKAVEHAKTYAPLLGVDTVRIFEIGTVFTKKGEHIELRASEEVGALLSDALGISLEGSVFSLSELITTLPDPENYTSVSTLSFNAKNFSPPSTYPFVLRDIAVWVPDTLEKSDLERLISENTGDLLVNMYLFDEFKKEGRTSYGFRLVFQSMEKTLTDDEVNVYMDGLTSFLNKQEGFEVR